MQVLNKFTFKYLHRLIKNIFINNYFEKFYILFKEFFLHNKIDYIIIFIIFLFKKIKFLMKFN